MFPSLQSLRALADVRQRVDEIQISEECGAVLTLRRTADLAITTAGTTITWQSAVRNFQFTWATTTITIPADGWYMVSVAIQTSVALNDLLYRLIVNGNTVQSRSAIGDIDRTNTSAIFMRYFSANDAVQIQLVPSANVNITANAEGSLESPILNIVQLSGGIG